MTLRKTGKCSECGQTLYGDEYGAAGHKCTSDHKIFEFTLEELKEKLYQAWEDARDMKSYSEYTWSFDEWLAEQEDLK